MPKRKQREESRECLMLLLYQMEIQKDFSPLQKERFLEQYADPAIRSEYLCRTSPAVWKSDPDYFDRLLERICLHLPEIDARLASSSSHWRVDRIAKVDLAILRLSTAEILFMKQVPVAASINEAVQLAKKFGGEDSGKFVNGVLGKIARENHEEQDTLDSGD